MLAITSTTKRIPISDTSGEFGMLETPAGNFENRNPTAIMTEANSLKSRAL
jgi:hypothetical protein